MYGCVGAWNIPLILVENRKAARSNLHNPDPKNQTLTSNFYNPTRTRIALPWSGQPTLTFTEPSWVNTKYQKKKQVPTGQPFKLNSAPKQKQVPTGQPTLTFTEPLWVNIRYKRLKSFLNASDIYSTQKHTNIYRHVHKQTQVFFV